MPEISVYQTCGRGCASSCRPERHHGPMRCDSLTSTKDDFPITSVHTRAGMQRDLAVLTTQCGESCAWHDDAACQVPGALPREESRLRRGSGGLLPGGYRPRGVPRSRGARSSDVIAECRWTQWGILRETAMTAWAVVRRGRSDVSVWLHRKLGECTRVALVGSACIG